MVDTNKFAIDSIINEVGLDANLFHMRMGLRVMSAHDSALVIAIEWSGMVLRTTKFMEKGTEPQDLLGIVEHIRYLASQEDSATMTCCFELHVNGPSPHLMMYLDTDLQFLDIAQLESTKEMKVE